MWQVGFVEVHGGDILYNDQLGVDNANSLMG